MKGFFRFSMFVMAAPLLCGAALVIGYVLIVVLTIPSLAGENVEEYSIKVAEAWRIGQKKIDNGVILLVAKQERKVRIEVGRGLEGKLTDLEPAASAPLRGAEPVRPGLIIGPGDLTDRSSLGRALEVEEIVAARGTAAAIADGPAGSAPHPPPGWGSSGARATTAGCRRPS